MCCTEVDDGCYLPPALHTNPAVERLQVTSLLYRIGRNLAWVSTGVPSEMQLPISTNSVLLKMNLNFLKHHNNAIIMCHLYGLYGLPNVHSVIFSLIFFYHPQFEIRSVPSLLTTDNGGTPRQGIQIDPKGVPRDMPNMGRILFLSISRPKHSGPVHGWFLHPGSLLPTNDLAC